jgi:hypothetical protein
MNIVIIISEKKELRMDELTLGEMDRDNQLDFI